MAKKKSARTIKVTEESKAKLAKLFGCTSRMVYKALCFECDTPLARKIQHVARKEMGGWIEAAVPEEEIFYDTMFEGERVMRQYFNNGAVMEINLVNGYCCVKFKGEIKKQNKGLMLVEDIPCMQEFARSLS